MTEEPILCRLWNISYSVESVMTLLRIQMWWRDRTQKEMEKCPAVAVIRNSGPMGGAKVMRRGCQGRTTSEHVDKVFFGNLCWWTDVKVTLQYKLGGCRKLGIPFSETVPRRLHFFLLVKLDNFSTFQAAGHTRPRQKREEHLWTWSDNLKY